MSPLYVVGMLGLLMKISAPMCAPTEYTIYIERQECNYCVAVNTTICMGFCFSRVDVVWMTKERKHCTFSRNIDDSDGSASENKAKGRSSEGDNRDEEYKS